MDVEAAFVPVIPVTLDAPAAKEGVPVKYPVGMVRVIVPGGVARTVVAGVNTRTGRTGEPTALYAMVSEEKAVTGPSKAPELTGALTESTAD